MEEQKNSLPAFVYKTWDEVDAALKSMGKLQSARKKKIDKLAEDTKKLEDKQMPGIKTLSGEINNIHDSIAFFTENNKATLDDASFINGDIYYSNNPPSLAVKEHITDENVIKKIKKFFSKKYSIYVRVKTDIAKQVIKKDFTEGKLTKKDLNKLGLEIVQTTELKIETDMPF